MVVGGPFNDVEIVDLSSQNNTCRQPANFPFRLASTGLFFNGQAIMCGGDYGYDTTQWCFSYHSTVIDIFHLCKPHGICSIKF